MTDQTKMPDADLVKPPTDADRKAALADFNDCVAKGRTGKFFDADDLYPHTVETIRAALSAQPVEQRFDVGKVREDLDFVQANLTKQWINRIERELVEDIHQRLHRIRAALLDVPAPGVGDKVRRAFQAGFEVSAEGYNGECNDGDVRGYLDRGFSKFEAAYAAQSKNAGAE